MPFCVELNAWVSIHLPQPGPNWTVKDMAWLRYYIASFYVDVTTYLWLDHDADMANICTDEIGIFVRQFFPADI